jgi:hypothetical protein
MKARLDAGQSTQFVQGNNSPLAIWMYGSFSSESELQCVVTTSISINIIVDGGMLREKH